MTENSAATGVITNPTQMTPDWLSSILRREGVLDRGKVLAVQTIDAPHLTVQYSGDAPKTAPSRLYLKLQQRRNIAGGHGRPEVRAYRAWGTQRERLPLLPRCYDALYDEDTARSHVLMQDFSATHTLPTWPVPSLEHQIWVTDCSARFHAHWWEHPDNRTFGTLDPNLEHDCGDEASYQAYARRYQEAYEAFADFAGDRLTAADRQQYEAILVTLPTLFSRYLAPRFASGARLTLIQGDSHWGQFACPADPSHDTTLLFDLECLHIGMPAADLAYRLPFSWTPEQRRTMEGPLIARYLEELRRCGIVGYDHEQFWEDYRLSFIFVALYALTPFTSRLRARTLHDWPNAEAPAWYWRDLALLVDNFRDLGCSVLL